MNLKSTPRASGPETLAPIALPGIFADPAIDCPHAQAGRLPAPRPRVISASKRTDIPAFYLPWFLQRCAAGWVDVPNPRFRHAADPLKRLSHVSLQPEHVLALVWWSKNYRIYERFAEKFAPYPVQFFHFTINPRRADLAWVEPDVPPLEEALRQMRFLATLPGGPDVVAWRYDPLLFWAEDGDEKSTWDPSFFEHMCRELSQIGIRRCITSLADPYRKFQQRLKRLYPEKQLREASTDEVAEITRSMAEIGQIYRIRIEACSEARLAARPGVERARCIDGACLSPQASRAAATDTKMPGREECGCTLHTDVGDYEEHECGYACIYCYANPNHERFGITRSSRRSRQE